MRCFKAFFYIGAMLAAIFVVGNASPVSADPTGTTFSYTSSNFQGTGGDPAVPFGSATYIPSSGVTVSSMVSTSPAVSGQTLGGLDFIEIWIDTFTPDSITGSAGDSGFLNGTVLDFPPANPLAPVFTPGGWLIDGLNWGPGSDPAELAFLLFISFDIDGVPVSLTSGLGLPIVPNPVSGADSIPLDFSGNSASTIPFDPIALTGFDLPTLLVLFGVPFSDVLSVNSMHIGFEVIHVPEPATLALMGVGLCSTLLMRRRKR